VFRIPPLSSDIMAVSLDGLGSPSININLPLGVIGSHALGWGFGWYPGDHQSAAVAKDPTARGTQVLMDALTDWSKFRSTVFFCKVRGADKGYTHTESQPFSRSFAGRDWMFMHNGDLDKIALDKLHGRTTRLLEPLGSTDSELAFCELLSQMQAGSARRISDIDPETLLDWFRRFDSLGSSDMYFTDGLSIACFHGSQSPKQLYYSRLQPPDNQGVYESPAARVTLNDPRDTYRTALIVSSSPFSSGAWTQMQPGQLIVIRRGAIVWESLPQRVSPVQGPTYAFSQPQPQQKDGILTPIQAEQAQAQAPARVLEQTGIPVPAIERVTNVRAITHTLEGKSLSYRLFEVRHTTKYDYSAPVERSTHRLRLQPAEDPIQEVVRCSLKISSPAEDIQYEDVFGNQAIHCTINEPYSELLIEATSLVKIFAAPPDDHSLSRRQTTIPLIWMPWQRQMMTPYLLPNELPESQLLELTDYAMSFVARNDSHLLKTIEDMNSSIYRDYKYVPGTTSLKTTPFEVYAAREGVCQDFANLLICLARLLSVPARYRMGYIYTGGNYANKIQSDASHAWAEVYLPFVGWRGFDPTNGCVVAQDHIRVACGRNYRDATPTSGTIFKGGGTETLTVDVKMRELHE